MRLDHIEGPHEHSIPLCPPPTPRGRKGINFYSDVFDVEVKARPTSSRPARSKISAQPAHVILVSSANCKIAISACCFISSDRDVYRECHDAGEAAILNKISASNTPY